MFARNIVKQSLNAGRTVARQVSARVVAPMVFAPRAPSMLHRHFSSEPDANTVGVILREQLAEEQEQEETTDESFDEVKDKVLKAFKVEEPAFGKTRLKLVRKYKNETITIEYDVQDQETMEKDFNDYSEDELNSLTDEEIEGDTGVKFSVEVQKDGSDKTLMIDLMTTGDIRIANIMMIPEGHSKDSDELYSGPNFNELDEELQGAWYQYLEERGIDNDTCYYILYTTNEREQKEYENWLKQCAEFMEV